MRGVIAIAEGKLKYGFTFGGGYLWYGSGPNKGIDGEVFVAGVDFGGVSEGVDRFETNSEAPNVGNGMGVRAFGNTTDEVDIFLGEWVPKMRERQPIRPKAEAN